MNMQNAAGMIVLSLVLAEPASAQRMLSRGTADQYNAAMKDEADWNNSKKLYTTPSLRQPQSPDPLLVEKGSTVDLSFWRFRVLDVVDPKNCLLQLGSDTTIWLEQFSTEDLVNNQHVFLLGQIKCTGTKSYITTLGGKRSVKTFAFISKEEIEAQKRKDEEAKEQALWRTWKSTAGTEVEAKFISYKFNVGVVLEKTDGTRITVPISKFVADDQQFIRLEAKARTK